MTRSDMSRVLPWPTGEQTVFGVWATVFLAGDGEGLRAGGMFSLSCFWILVSEGRLLGDRLARTGSKDSGRFSRAGISTFWVLLEVFLPDFLWDAFGRA